jgi:hypothetical protein
MDRIQIQAIVGGRIVVRIRLDRVQVMPFLEAGCFLELG